MSVEPPGLRIGRSKEGNDLVIESPYVSRQHAKILLQGTDALIQDLGSRNGTWVNGVKLAAEPTPLPTGAEVVLGHKSISFSFHMGDTTLSSDLDPEGRSWTVDLLSREAACAASRFRRRSAARSSTSCRSCGSGGTPRAPGST